MKAKGEYSPVTQEAKGEYAATRTDYQESRKTTAMGFGMVLVILAVIAGIVYFFWTEMKKTVGDTADKITQTVGAIVPNVLPSASDFNYYSQHIGQTVAADGSTYGGVVVEKGSPLKSVLDYFANIDMPFDDPYHNVNSVGSTANLLEAQALVDKMNAGADFTKDEMGWAKSFEPALYGLITKSYSQTPSGGYQRMV